MVIDNTSSSYQINNNVAVTGSIGNATSGSAICLGSRNTANFGDVAIYEFAIYTGSHTAAQKLMVKNYLARRWGITI